MLGSLVNHSGLGQLADDRVMSFGCESSFSGGPAGKFTLDSAISLMRQKLT